MTRPIRRVLVVLGIAALVGMAPIATAAAAPSAALPQPAVVAAAAPPHTAAPDAQDDSCLLVFPGHWCDVAAATGAVLWMRSGIPDAVEAARSAADAAQTMVQGAQMLGQLASGDYFAQLTAKLARSAAKAQGRLQSELLLLAKPDFQAPYFTTRYAVTFGVGCVVMAVTLIVAAGRMAGGGSAAMDLLRQSGWRAGLYVPVMAIVPGLLAMITEVVYRGAGWLAQQTTSDRATAVQQYLLAIHEMDPAGDGIGLAVGIWTLFGVSLITWAATLFGMVIVGLNSFAAQLFALVIPAYAAAAIYPRWEHRAKQYIRLTLALLATPLLLFVAYWFVWGLGLQLVSGTADSSQEAFRTLLYIMIGTVVAVLAPLIVAWLSVKDPPSDQLASTHTFTRPVSTLSRAALRGVRRGGG